ncbi:hypothetical protein GGI07_001424 [Coemansia sp. Benny D115]|nr:hypothetical protein GGI07_001424 [Coemansia sp. Benny D115]
MDVLASRLATLERLVFGDSDSVTELDTTLASQVLQIEHQLAKVLAENPSLAQGLGKYNKLQATIDGDSDIELQRGLLGVEAKAELILNNQTALQTLPYLRTIGDLQAKANQPEYKGLADELCKIEQKIEPQHEAQLADFKRVVEDISGIVDRYHAETQVLSEMFVRWDQLLTAMERKVLDAERQAKAN